MHIFILLAIIGSAYCDHHARTNMLADRSAIVHLFEWKWTDIADECERFLGPKGYGGIQISPPTENVIVYLSDGSRSWYERYQVMSYKLVTRSGNEKEFLDMTTRCNKVGVRIYADVIMNHMTANQPINIGTGGDTADFQNYTYPAVPYYEEHFHHPFCGVDDYNNATQVRDCELVGLKDLNQTMPYVRHKLIKYLNHLIRLGVAGFRVDAAKHMWPEDLKVIYERLDCLNTEFGFLPDTKPFIYQEVIYYGDGAVNSNEYISIGDVLEFRLGGEITNVFALNKTVQTLINWGATWIDSDQVVVFVDNHDTQRQNFVLTYARPRAYRGATAFLLAYPYGEPCLMSSFAFTDVNVGPPVGANETILSPAILKNGTCGNGWVCEHRWPQIYQMVSFSSVVRGTNVTHWWDNGGNHVAFGRGNKGFIAFNTNTEGLDLEQTLQTGLPAGKYCDVVTGRRKGNSCTGKTVTVHKDGKAKISVPSNAEDMFLAIHVGAESSLQYCKPSSLRLLNTILCHDINQLWA